MGALDLSLTIYVLCLFVVNGYEIVYPFKADAIGSKRELSNDVNGKDQGAVSFVLKRDVGDMALEVNRDTGFHADKILLRTFDDHGNPRSTMHAPESCHYSGKIADKEDSYVLLDDCEGLRGSIQDGEKRYKLEPINGREYDGAHKLYEVKNDDEELLKGTVGLGSLSRDHYLKDDRKDAIAVETESNAKDDKNDEYLDTRLIPGVDPVYAAYPITKKTRYCEMYLVVDNGIYVGYNRSRKLVISRMLKLMHAVDRTYAAVNIRVVLVAIEIWTDKDKVSHNIYGNINLRNFNEYRRNNLLGTAQHDIAHLMSKEGWRGGVLGVAHKGSICNSWDGTSINKWSFSSITGTNAVVAHELGHNLGFSHDTDVCKCLTTRGCFMGSSISSSRRPGFSDCNMKVLSDPTRSFHCLNNYPKHSYDNVCGNGIIEGSEECDCGTPEMCEKKDSCCQPHNCKLKRSSQCSDVSTPDCCKNCLFKRQGTLCREAQNNCDLPEYCTGRQSTCPEDVYRKDGTTCSNKVSLITGNTDASETSIIFKPPFTARYLRFNPIYWHDTQACMRMELLTCSANEGIVHLPQPISAGNLNYKDSDCLVPDSVDCSDSKARDPPLMFKREQFGDCSKPNCLFILENDGTLRHNCSGKVVCPDSNNFLSLKSTCPDNKGKYKRLVNFVLQNVKTGGCVEFYDDSSSNTKRAKILLGKDCSGDSGTTKFNFLATDCLLPAGFQNRKLPDSAFSASSFDVENPPKEARLNIGKSWCAERKTGKKEYLQVDLGLMKTVNSMRLEGTGYNWVTGFKLFYADDAKNWKGYSSNDDANKNVTSYCYSGNCAMSLNRQCKDLWDIGARSADHSCWNQLNTIADGFGTCDPSKNKSCDQKDIYCGQLQCNSDKKTPLNENYGSLYKEIVVHSSKCSAASITATESSNDEVGKGMVTEGTKCGDGKMCSGYSCKAIADLHVIKCPMVQGKECAGKGECDNKGKCHCSEGLDPIKNCTSDVEAVNGAWGQWTHWSNCSAACNSGRTRRSRFCDSPFPAHGGSVCVGDGYQEKPCNADACPKAKSCKLLKKKLEDSNKPMVDGVYDITMPDGSTMSMYCDMTRDGGGWTLVVTAHTNTWTSSDLVRERNKNKPSIWNDYSILKHVDQIKDNYEIDDKKFEYRLEAHFRGRWGGIWSVPFTYKFDTVSASQTDVNLTKKFDAWMPGDKAIQNRMPHIVGNWLTTHTRENEWGSIAGDSKNYHPAPWIDNSMTEATPEYIWYWMREGNYKMPRSCMEIRLRKMELGQTLKPGSYEIKSSSGKVINTLCDMDSFGGGWTLVLNRVSNKGWTKATTLSRNIENASKSEDYSILSYSKGITSLRQKEESTFQYLIEADGQQRWGGIFEAEIDDPLAAPNVDTSRPKLLKKFDNWDESSSNLAKRVPYLLDNPSSYLTTGESVSTSEDGVLVSSSSSIYIKSVKEKPSFIRVWVREISSKLSCNQIKVNGQRKGVSYKNGFHIAKKSKAAIRTLYCDMKSDPGAWTLLVTSARGNWTKQQVLSRNEDLPSIRDDYSILEISDSIKNLSNNNTIRYKLDAKSFNHWGGIWAAPTKYTFLSKSNKQTEVKLLKQFDTWKSDSRFFTVKSRMPWLGEKKGLLTTSEDAENSWWGTIISDNLFYNPAPWIDPQMRQPGIIWYWINEDDCGLDRKPVNGGFTEWTTWALCSMNCGKGISTRSRACKAPRCGGTPCDPKALTKEVKDCYRECPGSCKKDIMGVDYAGSISKTRSGIQCQKWSSQSPHSHGYQHLPNNYCRNPDKEDEGPWCYTTDSNKRWEFCDIPLCKRSCKNDAVGVDYRGDTSRTKSGIQCQKWSSQYPHHHQMTPQSYPNKGLVGNYCRNPDAEGGGPWCYTTNESKRWEYCDIPLCQSIAS